MKIVVIGGSGLIGKKLIPLLCKRGHEAVSASPSSGVNTITGAGLADAVKGATISTFGGNPVTATAAKAVIDYIDQHSLRTNAAETGAYLRAKLDELKERHPLIGDVRGMGLMQALELVEDRQSKAPAMAATAALMEAARENRLLIGKGGMFGNVIRISPPLNISRADVDECITRLDLSLSQL